MNVSLTPEIEQFIQSQVESGKYTSADEVILAALRAFEERERIYKGRFEELRQYILVGVEASERGEVVDGEIVFSQLQQKLQQLREREGEWVIFAGLLFRFGSVRCGDRASTETLCKKQLVGEWKLRPESDFRKRAGIAFPESYSINSSIFSG